MTHEMKLSAAPFALIKSGIKTVEMRLYDEKRRKVSEGDIIKFTSTEGGESISVKVKRMRVYRDFEELYESHSPLEIGYTDGETADPEDMLAYYSPENIARWGVVAIKIERIMR